MNGERRQIRIDWLLVFVIVFATASLVYHAHNAEFLGDYPNMPDWLTSAAVYGAWLALSALGAAGNFLVQTKHRHTGLAVLVIYAASGFSGIGHYLLAPVSAHSMAMHATIWIEAAAGALLLSALAGAALKRRKQAA